MTSKPSTRWVSLLLVPKKACSFPPTPVPTFATRSAPLFLHIQDEAGSTKEKESRERREESKVFQKTRKRGHTSTGGDTSLSSGPVGFFFPHDMLMWADTQCQSLD